MVEPHQLDGVSAENSAELTELAAQAGIRIQRDGRRADVVLDAAQTRNAQTPATWRALAALGAWLPSVADVVVLRAQGPTFSSGLDRRAFSPQGLPGEPGLAQIAALDDAALDSAIAEYQQGFACWSADGFVSIAAVQGHAIGAGFQLALACDLRVVADDAQFCMRETSFGLVPDLGGTYPLVHAIGYPRALELCATGRWLDAQEAFRLGLAQRVAAPGELAATVDALVAELLAVPPPALLELKPLLRGADRRQPPEQRAAERAAQARLLRLLAAGGRRQR